MRSSRGTSNALGAGWLLLLGLVGSVAPTEAVTTYIVGTNQNCPACRAESLLIVVNCLANNGDVIKVRKGTDTDPNTRTLYQFAPWAPQPQPGNCAPDSGCQQSPPKLYESTKRQAVAHREGHHAES
jgi:hypothetical protein